MSDSTQTRKLLAQIQSGHPDALDRLLAQHRDYLRRIVEMRMDRRTRRRVDFSDVVQEAQIEASRRIADYLERRPMPFRLWLRKTAHKQVERARERHVSTRKRSLACEAQLPFRSSIQFAARVIGSTASPTRQVGRRELAQRVRQAIAQLSGTEAEIVMMMDFEGLTSQEVGAVLDLDASTVRRRHGRALLRLHKLLTEGGLTESMT
jgi:RNA polymerase sigma-70 factor (ECF subfamily)